MKLISFSLIALGLFWLVTAPFATALALEKAKLDARGAVEGFVTAALAAKVDDAMALAVDGASPAKKKHIEALPRMIGVKALKIASVLASEKQGQAIAVSEAVKLTKANPDGRDTGVLVFTLVKSGAKWLVKDIDFRTEEGAKDKVQGFKKRDPDAKEIPDKAAK